MEYLIAFDSVQGGECVGCEQIKNSCAEISVTGVSGGQTGASVFLPAAISLNIKAALIQQRFHSEKLDYLLGGGHIKLFHNLEKILM